MPLSPETLVTFALASFLLIIIPGPTVLTVITQALAHGRTVAFASVAGVALGDLAAASLSVLGVGAVLAASATLFTVMKWLGAAYLVYIGIRMWTAPITPPAADAAEGSPPPPRRKIFRDAFLVTVFNPKSIIFFVAFLPQFIKPQAPYAPQAAMLVAIFVVVAALNTYAYALLASGARRAIQRPSVLRRMTRAGGSALVMAGFATMLAPRV